METMETSSNKQNGAQNGYGAETSLLDKSISSSSASTRNKSYVILLIICGVIIITLGILNLYQAGVFDVDNDESNVILCNGKGQKYDDINVCECIQCWSGDNCEIENEDCYISAGSGQPYLFLEFWDKIAKQGDIETFIPINYRVPYQSNMIGPFRKDQNSTFAQKLAQVIRNVHIKYHNVNMTNKHIVFGVGASQLTTASFIAFSKMKQEYPVIMFDQVPYYFGYPSRCRGATEYHCEWWGNQEINSSEINRIVEIVTIPNNPNGLTPQRIYPEIDTFAYDLVYYWPHFYDSNDELEIKTAPLSYFSFTKFTGHAASRFGWAVAESSLASQIRSQISSSVLSLSVETMIRAYNIFKFIEERGDEYFDYVRDRMSERWTEFLEILQDTDAYVLEGRIGSQYAWIKCVNKTHEECQSALKSKNLNPYWGTSFGIPLSQGYVRFNLAEYEDTWQRILKNFKSVVDDEDF